MIRWARRIDRELGISAATLSAWRVEWLERWSPPGGSPRRPRVGGPPVRLGRLPAGREALVLAVAVPSQLEHHLDELALGASLRPGTRLVALLGHRIEDGGWSPDLLALLERRGWAPEVPHRCDPLPQDARATAAWRVKEQVLVDRLGRTIVGAVLSKKLQTAPAEGTTFVAAPAWPAAGAYFPLPASGRLPLPERVSRGSPFTAGDFAAALGVQLQDAIPLLDELLASGAVSIARWRGVR